MIKYLQKQDLQNPIKECDELLKTMKKLGLQLEMEQVETNFDYFSGLVIKIKEMISQENSQRYKIQELTNIVEYGSIINLDDEEYWQITTEKLSQKL